MWIWMWFLACGSGPGGPSPDVPTVTEPTGSSTTDPGTTDCVTDEAFFAASMSAVAQADCIACHVEGGVAGATRHVLLPDTEADHLEVNRAVLELLALEQIEGESLLRLKALGEANHGGGPRMTLLDDAYAVLDEFVARTEQPGGCEHPGELPEACVAGEVEPGTVPLRRLTDVQVANAMRDLVGFAPSPGVFPKTGAGSSYSTWADANVMSSAGVEGVMNAAEEVADAVAADLSTTGCAPSDAVCLKGWVDALAGRAWRRPLSSEEQALIDVVWASDADPVEQVRRTVGLLFQTPQFLYLDEQGGEAIDADVQHLDDHAIASRLSFFLLHTTPDDALLDLAASGALHTRAQVLAKALELVHDPRALPVVAQFHQDWLHTYQLDTIAKDASVYPQFGPSLVADMKTELDLFTTEVVFSGNGTFDELLYGRTTWTTPALDALYGTSSARTGDGWERRELDATRPGVLSRTAFLTAHSYSATSAPVRRGVFVIEQMLCEALTPPPGISLELEEPTETNTIRDRLSNHAQGTCAECHDTIDPVGFAFEHYGALGEWRDEWANGIPVDATGTLDDPVVGSFNGLSEMLAVVDHESIIRDCYVRQWFQYAVGRPAELEDTCALDTLGSRFELTGGDLHDLLAQLAATDAMRTRHVEAP
jgi:hypothetical protein